MGFENRWVNTHGGPSGYPDFTENGTKGLTCTTPPLGEDLEVTGHPVVNLWVTSSADDGDFFVYLEEVDAEGRSNYVSEGVLRASHRAGHRLRITITGADAGNNLTPKRSPAPRVRLYRDGERRSHVTLPVIPSARRATRE